MSYINISLHYTHTHTHTHTHKNPMDRGAWQVTVLGSQRVGHDWATKHTYGAHSCVWSSQTPVKSVGFISCFLCPHPLLPGKRSGWQMHRSVASGVPKAALTSRLNTAQAYLYSTCATEWGQGKASDNCFIDSTLQRLLFWALGLTELLGRLSPGKGRPLMLREETKYSCFNLVEKWHTPNLILKPACDHKEITQLQNILTAHSS